MFKRELTESLKGMAQKSVTLSALGILTGLIFS